MSKNKNQSVAAVFVCLTVSAIAQGTQQRPNFTEAPLATPLVYQAPPVERRAMTVDELINSGKLSQGVTRSRNDAEMPVALPHLNSGLESESPNKTEKPVATHAKVMSLTGIYMSSESSKVAIDANGLRKIYAPGDVVTGGWKVLSIAASGVDLERCVKAKCSSKFLFLND
jgi:hypothetical protein